MDSSVLGWEKQHTFTIGARETQDGAEQVTGEFVVEVLKEKDFVLDYGGELTPEEAIVMLWVEPGTFMMGSPESEEGREPQEILSEVKLTHGYWLEQSEMTQKGWYSIMGPDSNRQSNYINLSDQTPIYGVNWDDAMEFCNVINQQEKTAGRLPEGYEYSLPTEAQWEYACRAGSTTAFSYGSDLSSYMANFNGNFPYGNAEQGPNLGVISVVAEYNPNIWGFYDMHGNVWEWCRNFYYDYASLKTVNPIGPPTGSTFVYRGGSFDSAARGCRSALRGTSGGSDFYSHTLGFRMSLSRVLELNGFDVEEVNEQELLIFNSQPFGTRATSPDLVYSMNNAPTGSTINPETGEFSWTPTEEQGPGTYTFEVSVTDGDVVATEEVTIMVNEVNQPPAIIDFGKLHVNGEEELQFTFQAVDPDNTDQSLTYSIVDVPDGVSIDAVSGLFKFDPKVNDLWGAMDLELEVSDGVDSVKAPVRVIANRYDELIVDYGGELVGDEVIKMIWVEPGTFMMGSPDGEAERRGDETQHKVTLTEGFWMGETELTQGQWESMMGTTVSDQRNLSDTAGHGIKGASFNHPIYYVSWKDIEEFCQKLTESEKEAGRLPVEFEYYMPTEAQWEYTCRAGTTTAFAFGDLLTAQQANFAWSPTSSLLTKSYAPNAWGFYDMHGNVWEWCADWYDYNYYLASPNTDPVGPAVGTSERVVRGGSWNDAAWSQRSANRWNMGSSARWAFLGFRLSLRIK